MGLEDRDALRVLHAAFAAPVNGGDSLIGRFFTRWFGTDPSVRDLFPADLDAQRAAFAHAMHWVYGELIAQRAQEPVAFLAQLGRDHRKYGVTQRHYDTLSQVLHATLRDHLAGAWT
ncbi:MAG: globin domain-containing protein, partial [Mycobacterium sp.]